jgi:hypothetical protein
MSDNDKPVAWMFQHDETGRATFATEQDIAWGFEENNPRLHKICPLYTHRQHSGLVSVKTCEWEQEEDGFDIYHTQCGETFELGFGTPVGHEYEFCCYCGGVLVEKLWVKAAQELIE